MSRHADRLDPQQSLRQRAAWLLRFAEMELGTRDDRRLREAARQQIDPGGRLLQWGELHDVHRRLNAGLAQVRSGGQWRLATRGEYMLAPGPVGLNGPLVGRYEVEPNWPWERFLIAAMDLLAGVGDRLRTCRRDGCRRAFIAVKRQVHCAACAAAIQQERVRDWRRRHPQRVRELAHATYVRRRRLETGQPGLRVKRQPRVVGDGR